MKIANHIKWILRVFKTFKNPAVFYLDKLMIFSSDKVISVKLRNGLVIKMPSGNSSINNIPECYFTDFFPEINKIERGSNIVDIGASVGVVSLLAAKNGGRVFAFEPNPRRFELLQRNISLNGFEKQVFAYPFCVASRKGKRTLFEDTLITTDKEGGQNYEVDCVGLDDIFRLTGLERIDFLKIDVEGAELEILKNSKRLNRVAKIAVEYHEPTVHPGDIRALLEKNGLSLVRSRDFNMFYATRT